MNIYGIRVREALLTRPRTLEEMAAETGFQYRFIFEGIRQCRAAGHSISAIPGQRIGDGVEPTTYRLEDRT